MHVNSQKHSLISLVVVGIVAIVAGFLLFSSGLPSQNDFVGAGTDFIISQQQNVGGNNLPTIIFPGASAPSRHLMCGTSGVQTYSERSTITFSKTINCINYPRPIRVEEACKKNLENQIKEYIRNLRCSNRLPSDLGFSCGTKWCPQERSEIQCDFTHHEIYTTDIGTPVLLDISINNGCQESQTEIFLLDGSLTCSQTVLFRAYCEAQVTCDGNCAVQ